MKKTIKKILIVILVIIICLLAYIAVDCVKLRNSKMGTKPLITLNNKVTTNGFEYTGLGYTIKYYYDTNVTKEYDMILTGINGYGAEFRLFGKILIWAWVE